MSRNSISSSWISKTRMSKPNDCNSLTNTRNDSGTPGFGIGSPLTIASYVFTRPTTSSDLYVKISCRV